MWFFVLVLLDPAKSAEPPINVLFSLVSALSVSSEALREAKFLFSLTEFSFSDFKALEKLFLKTLSTTSFFFYKLCSINADKRIDGLQ